MSTYINIKLPSFINNLILKYNNRKIEKELNFIKKEFNKTNTEFFDKILPNIKISDIQIFSDKSSLNEKKINQILIDNKINTRLKPNDIIKHVFLLKDNQIQEKFNINFLKSEREKYIKKIISIKGDSSSSDVILAHFRIKQNDTFKSYTKTNLELKKYIFQLKFSTTKHEIFNSILPNININDVKKLSLNENTAISEELIKDILLKNNIKTKLTPFDIAENFYYQKNNQIKNFLDKNNKVIKNKVEMKIENSTKLISKKNKKIKF